MKNIQWIHKNTLHGAMAKWAVKQHPYNRPPRLFEACEDLVLLFGEDTAGMVKIDVRRFRRQVVDFCHAHPVVAAWNVPRKGKSMNVFTSRYDQPRPEFDFIDLDALSGNIVREVGHEAEIVWPERRPSKCHATVCSSTTIASAQGRPMNG